MLVDSSIHATEAERHAGPTKFLIASCLGASSERSPKRCMDRTQTFAHSLLIHRQPCTHGSIVPGAATGQHAAGEAQAHNQKFLCEPSVFGWRFPTRSAP